jgi:trehalose-6-phosphate synthase
MPWLQDASQDEDLAQMLGTMAVRKTGLAGRERTDAIKGWDRRKTSMRVFLKKEGETTDVGCWLTSCCTCQNGDFRLRFSRGSLTPFCR